MDTCTCGICSVEVCLRLKIRFISDLRFWSWLISKRYLCDSGQIAPQFILLQTFPSHISRLGSVHLVHLGEIQRASSDNAFTFYSLYLDFFWMECDKSRKSFSVSNP